MSAARSRRANDKHNHLQRTPILVMGCSLLIACCIAFGGTNWTASAQPSEDQLPEQNAIVEPGYYQETIGSYEAISQSDDDERAENLRLAAEAINGYVIEPGATFSFNEVVGDTTAERGYKEAPVLYSSGLGSSDGGGICQVSTALYIAAVKADLEIVERHPHSVPSDVFETGAVIILPLIFGIDGIWFSVTVAEMFACAIAACFMIGLSGHYGYRKQKKLPAENPLPPQP